MSLLKTCFSVYGLNNMLVQLYSQMLAFVFITVNE